MIASVIRMQNDMVMVFDEEGREIPEYQGPYASVRSMIIRGSTRETVFRYWYGTSHSPTTVGMGEW